MAKGKRCPTCGTVMYAQDEKYEPKGTWVTYICTNFECKTYKRSGYHEKEKIFEGN